MDNLSFKPGKSRKRTWQRQMQQALQERQTLWALRLAVLLLPVLLIWGWMLGKNNDAGQPRNLPAPPTYYSASISAQEVQRQLDGAINDFDNGRAPSAVLVFKQFAEQGNARARLRLAVAYGRGMGVPLDAGKAKALMVQAAEGGEADACVLLGDQLLQNHENQADNRKQAYRWYLRAAVQGESKSLFMLGEAFALGRGVAPDRIKAYALHALARRKENFVQPGQLINEANFAAQSAVRFNALAREMTTEELAQAQALVERWQLHPEQLNTLLDQG